MPLQRCKVRGKLGWKWGESGRCYVGFRAKAKASKQAQAIYTSGYTGNARKRPVKRINPLRVDPSRTATIRRKFEAEVKRRFNELRRDVRDLLLKDDAFGLVDQTRNSFCPTGPGGGIDPTCSPEKNNPKLPSESRPSLTDAEMNEVRDYLSEETPYYEVNEYLRDGGRIVEGTGAAILQRAIEKSGNFQQPVIAKRGFSLEDPSQLVEELRSGTYTDPGFMSASTSRGFPGNIQFTIKVSRGLDASSYGFNTEEILLPAGSEFRVSSLTVKGSKVTAMLEQIIEVVNEDVTANEIHQDLKGLILKDDTFGLKDQTKNESPTVNDRFRFLSTPEQVEAFQKWLAQQIQYRILGMTAEQVQRAWWEQYTREGYLQGAGRAFKDTRKFAKSSDLLSWYGGTEEDFLRSSFGRPVAVEKVQLLASRTFMDLKNATEQMATTMRRTLTDGLVQGKNPWDIAKELDENIEGVGKTRALTIARTEIIRAHAEGNLDALEQLGVEDVGVMVEWSTAGDDRVCELCAPLEGVVFRIEELRGMIPRHPQCLPGDSLVTSVGRITAASKRWFDGDMVVIKTASGRELSCTPNHPILTDLGWVPAQDLDLSSKVVCDGRREWERVIDGKHEDVPSSIHDVAESLFRSGEVATATVPLSPVDFHGDGMDGQIAVIGTDRRLLLENDPSSLHRTEDGYLQGRDIRRGLLDRGRMGTLGLPGHVGASGCIVSGPDLSGPLLRRHLAPLESLSLGGVSQLDPSINESLVDDLPTDLQFLCKSIAGLPREVFLDDVVSIHRSSVSCHVYNLQTETEWYTANGIITHNCRCTPIPANVGEDQSGQTRGQKGVEGAIEESLDVEGKGHKTTWVGADKSISKMRPESLVNPSK